MPGPLSYVVSGQTDATGAAIVRLDPQLVPLEWACVSVLVGLSGAPTIAVMVGGVIVAVGGGPQPTIGPIIIPPNAGQSTLDVSAGPPLTAFTAQVLGWSDPSQSVAQAMGAGAGGGGGGAASQNVIQAQIDGPLDITDVGGVYVGGSVTYGPFNCSNWQSFAFNLLAGAIGQIEVQFTYSADEAGLQPVAARSFVVDGNESIGFQAVIPNGGPWLTVTATEVNGLSLTMLAFGFRTQRTTVPYVFGRAPFEIDLGATNIGAGGSLVNWPDSVVGGPWGYRWTATKQANLTIAALDNVPAYRNVHQESLAANQTNEGIFDSPDTTTRWTINNTDATGGQFSLFAWVISTGAR